MKPLAHEYAGYYDQYIDRVGDDANILTVLADQIGTLEAFTSTIDDDKARYRYADGKWSIKELFGHLMDSERIFGYRALCIARGETQPLPGFDEETYVANAIFDERKLGDIIAEMTILRKANLLLFASLAEQDVVRQGIANGKPVTPRALMWILAGHTEHHLGVLKERYL
ncbi:MAG: DinB family protein ['Candidatus Kapabacteria' thiocyanatum]|nr:DinB family protein ['Candidatus Kapabacteria' thiocyanatum]